jgi:hypothetical protein
MHHRVGGRDDYGQYYDLAIALSDGPRSLEQIKGHYESYLRLLGIFTPLAPFNFTDDEWNTEIRRGMKVLEEWEWAEYHDGLWELTEKGLLEAEKPLKDVRRSKQVVGNLLKPETVSKVSVGVHIFLAAVKLPAALLSGSVGLLNDGIDTLLDGLSSVFVYFGLKFDKERLVNLFLTLLMLFVASFTLYESVQRFLRPYSPDVDWFTFSATIISALLCGLLYFYQGFVGSRTGRISLITQSVDSRNHVIVAASVTAGLVGSVTGYAMVDTLVGLGVALLIMRSALELLFDTIRAMGDDELDDNSYHFPFEERFQRFRRNQLLDYLLYTVKKGEAETLDDLRASGKSAYDFSNNPMLRELGVSTHPMSEEDSESVISELVNEGYVEGVSRINLTEKGLRRIDDRLKSRKHRNYWS